MPAVAIVVSDQGTERRRARERAVQNALQLTRLAAARQAAVFNEARRLLLTLSRFPAFHGSDPAVCNEFLPTVLHDHPGYANIWVSTADGSPFCSAIPIDPAVSDRGRPWFELAMRTRQTAVGDYQISVKDGKPDVVMAQPMFGPTGRIERVIAAGITLDQLRGIVTRAQLPRGATVTLSDRNRAILARYPDGAGSIGQRQPRVTVANRDLADGQVIETTDVDGLRRLYAMATVDAGVETGLTVTMAIEASSVFAEADQLLREHFSLLGLITVLTVAVALVGGRLFVVRPIEALTSVMKRISTGDYQARAQLAVGLPGLSDLGDAINQMTVALEVRQEEREHAAELLRDSVHRYRFLFDQSPYPMWVYDLETLQFLEVNDAAVRQYGCSHDEFLAMRLTDIRPPEDIDRLMASMSGSEDLWDHRGQWRHWVKSGALIDVEIISHALTFNGRAARLVLAQDVTARIQVEQARRTLAAVVEDSEDAIVSTNMDGVIVSWNGGAERLYGFTAADAVGQPISIVFPKDHADEFNTLFQRLRRGEPLKNYEAVRQRKDGVLVLVSLTVSPIKSETGELTGWSAIARDISERQRAELALRESEERFRRIAETIAEVFWIADLEFQTMIYVSPAYQRVWGRTCESVYDNPRSFLDAVHPDDRARVLEDLKVQQDGQPFDHEYRIIHPDGQLRWIWDHGFPVPSDDGRVVQYVGVAQDITDRKRADEEMWLLARAIESTNEMVSVTDVNDRFTFVNQAFLRTYGYRLEEVIGQTPALVRSPDTPEAVAEGIADETLRAGWQGELKNRRRDGTELTISLNTSAIRDQDGRIIGLLGVARDITERIRAEEALDDAEQRMRFALESSRVGVWEADLKTGFGYWSETCEALHGQAAGSFGRNFDAFVPCIHPEDREQVRQTIDHAMLEHEDADLVYRTIWPDGSEHWISSMARFFYDENGAPIRGAGTAMEITERRSLEEQVRQAQKMDVVGQLAGGIAHDFNNMLTVILGNAEYVCAGLPVDHPHRGDVEEIANAARRSATLTQQLLAFSRKQILTPCVLHLGDVVGDVTPMLRRLLGETIDLKAIIGNRWHVKADVGQMEQILVNLAVNARDAMPAGGCLTIETTDVALDATYARRHPAVHAGSYVMIAVSDTGHGMDAATQSRIFEPFFTTKPQGQGTGLGLATVYGIVRQSGGHIRVYSEVDHGTTFKIYMPRTQDMDQTSQWVPADRRSLGGQETILVVEDEDVVRNFVWKALISYGYTVHAMSNPKQAIEFAGTLEAAFSLILTDIVLPEMNGRSMASQLLLRHPDAKVLYMSGYTDSAMVHRGLLQPAMSFLQKPFTAEVLARRVRDLLDASPATVSA